MNPNLIPMAAYGNQTPFNIGQPPILPMNLANMS